MPLQQLTTDAHHELAKARENATRAKKTIWIVFAVALLISLYLRYERTDQLAQDLEPIVEQIHLAVTQNREASVAAIQKALVAQLNSDADENKDHAALARILAYHFKRHPDLDVPENRSRFLADIRAGLMNNCFLFALIHTALLSIFPGSFAISITRALDRVEDQAKTQPAAGPVVAPTFRKAVLYHRGLCYLHEEARPLFWRRFAVFLLFSLSITYMMAPAGLYASITGELLTLFPIPGDPTQPFWFAEFARVQPFVLGLAGFLIYSLITFAHGVVTGELGNRFFLALWNRGMTVVILSLVLTAMKFDSAVLNALIFVAGVFPQTGLQAIVKLAQRGAEQAAALNPAGLSKIPQIDSFGESALRTLGIFNLTDLAKTDLEELLKRSAMQPAVLLKVVDRALLLDALGDLADKLATIPIHTASELLLYLEGRDAYVDRWTSYGVHPPRHIAAQLDANDKLQRLEKVNAAMEVTDVSIHVDRMKMTHNLQFIIDNALCYSDA